jgi:polyribonucleotide nucleotidyltransferase
MVLATVCSGKERDDADFFPLSVDYVAKTYAAGRIPGGFFKREGKLSEQEVLSSRLIDRTIRPLFPKGYRNEIQVIAMVVSADEKFNPDVLGITAASCALSLSKIPFAGPIAGVRVSMVDNNLVVLPTLEEVEQGSLDLIVSGSESSIVMVEGNAWEVKESVIVDAIMLAHQEIKKLVAVQREMMQKCGVTPVTFTPPQPNAEIAAAVRELLKDKLHDISFHGIKQTRYAGMDTLLAETKTALAEKFPEAE